MMYSTSYSEVINNVLQRDTCKSQGVYASTQFQHNNQANFLRLKESKINLLQARQSK